MERNDKGQFVKGRIMTEEEKLKASRSLKEAAKLRPDYIGDIKDQYPRIYNSWRAIIFTDKGKRAGHAERWANFRNFFNDTKDGYEAGLVLRRKDIFAPWGPDNFVWVTTEEAGSMKAGTFLEYNGEIHSFKEWAEITGSSLHGIKLRYYRREQHNYSTEEILYGRKHLRNSKKPLDKGSTKVSIRAKASKMIASYRHKDKSLGLSICDITIPWMIDNILTKPCVYCGDTQRVGCDRIDNSKGHTKDNVVPCCVECNAARNNYFTYEEMVVLGQTIREIKSKRNTHNVSLKTDSQIIEEAKHDKEYVYQLNQKKVFKYSLSGELIASYSSENQAALENGVSAKSVNAVVNGKGYKKSFNGHKLKGFLWYKDGELPDNIGH